jgi:hypothetical protein
MLPGTSLEAYIHGLIGREPCFLSWIVEAVPLPYQSLEEQESGEASGSLDWRTIDPGPGRGYKGYSQGSLMIRV